MKAKAKVNQIQFIQQYYLQRTDQEIADILNISKSTVAKIRKELNLTRSSWTKNKLKASQGPQEPSDQHTDDKTDDDDQ